MLKENVKFWGIVAAVFVFVYCLLLGIANAEPFQKTACSTTCETTQLAEHKNKKMWVCWYKSTKSSGGAWGMSKSKGAAKDGAKEKCVETYRSCVFDYCEIYVAPKEND